MKLLPVTKILRLLMAASVSVWMAGAGCLLGCSNETQASSLTPISSTETVVADDSCASSSSHDCCAKKKRKPAPNTVSENQTDKVQLSPVQSPMIESCPMALSAAAVVSKVRTDVSHAVLTRPVRVPFAHDSSGAVDVAFNQPNLFNRGPTYLRCCVFLI